MRGIEEIHRMHKNDDSRTGRARRALAYIRERASERRHALLEAVRARMRPAVQQVKRIHHVAVVVKDLDAALTFFELVLGMEVTDRRYISEEQAEVAFLPLGESEVELVQPTTPDSGVARFLQKRGEGLHHVCLEVEDLDLVLGRLRELGTRLIGDPPQTDVHGVRYAFVHPHSTHGVLLELYELPK